MKTNILPLSTIHLFRKLKKNFKRENYYIHTFFMDANYNRWHNGFDLNQ